MHSTIEQENAKIVQTHSKQSSKVNASRILASQASICSTVNVYQEIAPTGMNPLKLAGTADLIESGISSIVSIGSLLANPHVLEEEDGSTEFADTRLNQDAQILIFSVCAHVPSEQEEVEELA